MAAENDNVLAESLEGLWRQIRAIDQRINNDLEILRLLRTRVHRIEQSVSVGAVEDRSYSPSEEVSFMACERMA